MKRITIHTLLLISAAGNLTPDHLDAWIDKIIFIAPEHVQIYTLGRPSPTKELVKLSKQRLGTIREQLRVRGILSASF
ncbi:hypothetical protein JXO59_11755 [candidate division KSB1 bacterium]|nr:hypothetical protein [candidate division KSB1 bacterium]